ncbi:hypothetical protein DX933_11440 [Ornithinibacillus gellani]|uniref:hypothetical protein n=1 Tax=Ornithinibacillus gellani TaxID=2293253 RepID=UPI000F495086|nr:hypothetical protein [Ornithinibacillus gellani]TQS74548.1 hypothetical protein DX933_11440 [Ornithinibacillus gellani]
MRNVYVFLGILISVFFILKLRYRILNVLMKFGVFRKIAVRSFMKVPIVKKSALEIMDSQS